MRRTYPDEPVGGFPTPPRTITDDEDHTIRLQVLSDRESLAEMYYEFDPDDRAQGIPPLGESAVRDWLDRIVEGDTVNVVARHDDATVGHATLVGETEYELAIFVLQGYQGCGIGTELLRTTLGVAAECGIEYVWLSVERWNRPAIGLYSKLGFEQIDKAAIELEMTLWLQTEH